ncbi:MAG: NAD(P)-binding protein [Chloroflexi bacterium]|nr:NAD(P)-binding protein [Chloroflexota bacterium]
MGNSVTDRDSPPLVVGAGVAGLACALRLAQAGLRPRVFEANPLCGGRLSGAPLFTLEHAGRSWDFPGEHGIHGFWTQYRNLRALLDEHGIRPPFTPARGQEWIVGAGPRVRRAELGSWLRHSPLPAPFHYLALLANPRFLAMFSPLDLMRLPWVGGMLLATALSLDPMREGDLLEGMTVADLLWGWPDSLRAFVFALARNGLSSDAGAIDLAGFIAFLRFYTFLRRDAGAFDYLAENAGTAIIDPLVAALREAGGTVVTGVRATALEPLEGGDWLVRWERTGPEGVGSQPVLTSPDWGAASGTVAASQVVLAADAPGTRAILTQGAATAPLAGRLHWPQARPAVIVRLWFGTSPRLRAESGMCGGDFTIDNFFWLHALQTPFQRWHEATDGSAVEAHIYSPPELLEQPDTALLALAVHDVLRAYPELRGTILASHLTRNPATHTLFQVGVTDRHLGVQTPWQGVWCCGDWIRHESPALFLERACVTGLAAANGVLAAHGLPACPLVPYAGPEPLARLLELVYRGARRGMARVRRAVGR